MESLTKNNKQKEKEEKDQILNNNLSNNQSKTLIHSFLKIIYKKSIMKLKKTISKIPINMTYINHNEKSQNIKNENIYLNKKKIYLMN